MALYYHVRYGADKGTRLFPHRYRDGKFRVRSKPGDRWIGAEEHELEAYLAGGYILRMSAKGHAPSGIAPHSIEGWQK